MQAQIFIITRDVLCHPGYDHGDCCQESCVDTDIAVCGVEAPYDCIDPDYADPEVSFSFSFEQYGPVGDGNCDSDFNFKQYGRFHGPSVTYIYLLIENDLDRVE